MNDFETGMVVFGILILVWQVHKVRQATARSQPEQYRVQVDFECSDDDLEFEFLQKSMNLTITPRVGDTINITHDRNADVHRVIYGEDQWPSIILKHHPLKKAAYERVLEELRDEGWK